MKIINEKYECCPCSLYFRLDAQRHEQTLGKYIASEVLFEICYLFV